MEIRKISRRCPCSVGDAELGHFTLFSLLGTAKKCTKIFNTHAQLLFCSLNLLFGDVLVTVVVVVCLSSLLFSKTVAGLFAALYIGFCHSFDVMTNTPRRIYFIATSIGKLQ